MLTNPPPSSGGVLIAYALAILERLGEPDLESVVGAMEAAQAARTEAFLEGLRAEGFEREFLDSAGVAQAASMVADRRQALEGPIRPDDRLGSTTHITAVDGDGRCASVTCSNGTGSGLIVPGTGVHVNNMLGEEDLNPRGVPPPRARLTDAVDDVADGAAARRRARGRARQRRVQPDPLGGAADGPAPGRRRTTDRRRGPRPARALRGGSRAGRARRRREGLERLEARGEPVRWRRRNVFFGGVHAVARDPRPARSPAAATPAAAGPSRSPEPGEYRHLAVAIDFEAEGLLKGTRGKARDARRELLAELADDGVSLDELRLAVDEDRLGLLAVERLLEGMAPAIRPTRSQRSPGSRSSS